MSAYHPGNRSEPRLPDGDPPDRLRNPHLRTPSPRNAFIAILLAAASIGCQRADPLSALPKDSGTEMLRKTALGSDTLLICVTPTLREPCTRRTAEVVVDGVAGDTLAVMADWKSDNVVTLRFGTGDIRRLQRRSRSGRVSLQPLS
jgi:hypothetical protein